MSLTKKGEQATSSSEQEKRKLANNLMAANGNPSAEEYAAGCCYDAVVFVRYLLGGKITKEQLTKNKAKEWEDMFKADNSKKPWNGQNIPPGTAVIFIRQGEEKPFHAALAIGGGKTVRGVNGGLLGTGWCNAGDRDLSTLAKDGDSYRHDQKSIKVWLSSL
jgi:hypothetical protein